MADKSFGVKDINLIGASGVPTIDSPNNLNINAVNVAISTDITVAGKVSLGAGTSISSPGTNVLTLGTNSVEGVRIASNGRVGINETAPLGQLHVRTADSGASSVGASADELVIEGSGHAGMTILSGTDQQGIINFADPADVNIGQILYDHSDNSMRVRTNDAERLRITSEGYPWIQNEKTTSFTNNSTVTILTIGSHNNAVVKFMVQASDTGYRQHEWAGEYTAFVSDAAGSPGVSYYLKEHWQDFGSGSWNSPVVTVSINSSGQVQFNATNSNSDAGGTVYVTVLSVTSISSTIPTIS